MQRNQQPCQGGQGPENWHFSFPSPGATIRAMVPVSPLSLLEREPALALITQLVDKLRGSSPQGRCLLLEGGPGIGKTSLLQAARHATAVETNWWCGTCEPLLAPPPLAPLLDMLAALPPTLADSVRRGLTGGTLYAGLLSLMQDTRVPVVLVIDDAQ